MSVSDHNLSFWLAVTSLAMQATRDPLTGLYNRRYFDETLKDHIEAARRYDRNLSLVFLDIDGFKQINDSRGHEAGDAVLRELADRLRSTARKADIVCRYGGDEFAIILPETGRDQARMFVERIQGESAAVPTAGNEAVAPPAFTAGIAALPCDNLVASADAELLREKRASRLSQNR